MTLKVDLNKDLEKKFRQLAMEKFGYSKGSIKKATHDAIESWTKENLKWDKKNEIEGKKFVLEFISIPRKKFKAKIDIKKIIEEE